MESHVLQSIFLAKNMIDHDAKIFIESAYNIGIFVKLIDKFLKKAIMLVLQQLFKMN